MDFKDAISIAGLYLALVSLLEAFFFIQLSQWITSINATDTKWKKVRTRTPRDTYFDQRLECYYEAVQLSSIWTFVGWVAVTSFLIVILVFLEILRSRLTFNDNWIIYSYVSWPSYIFLIIYMILSIIILITGYRKIMRVFRESSAEV